MSPEESALLQSEAAEIIRHMEASEASRTSGDPRRLGEAITEAQAALDLLKVHPQAAQINFRRLLTGAWKLLGLAQEDCGTEESSRAAVAAFDEALGIFVEVMDEGEPQVRHELGSLWTHRGMALLIRGGPEELPEALQSFEKAITARRSLDLEAFWHFRWGLAASLMNRADTLTRLGSADELAEALKSYDEALKHLADIPSQDPPPGAVRQRQVVAWMNRGLTLQTQATEASLRESLRSFQSAIDLLRESPIAGHPRERWTLACVLVNRGKSLLEVQPREFENAQQTAKQALELLADQEDKNPMAADAGLKARHTLCQALAGLVEQSDSSQAEQVGDWTAEITDVVDDGLKIAQLWESRGFTHFRPIVLALFRFGARIFVTFQPHFLSEFLLESLDPERSDKVLPYIPEMHSMAHEALWHAVDMVRRRYENATGPGQAAPDPAWVERQLEVLSELQATDERLTALRRGFLASAVSDSFREG